MDTAETPLLCWEVEVNSLVGYAFATTAAKARWQAVKAYWEAYGRRRGEWPICKAHRYHLGDTSRAPAIYGRRVFSLDYL